MQKGSFAIRNEDDSQLLPWSCVDAASCHHDGARLIPHDSRPATNSLIVVYLPSRFGTSCLALAECWLETDRKFDMEIFWALCPGVSLFHVRFFADQNQTQTQRYRFRLLFPHNSFVASLPRQRQQKTTTENTSISVGPWPPMAAHG